MKALASHRGGRLVACLCAGLLCLGMALAAPQAEAAVYWGAGGVSALPISMAVCPKSVTSPHRPITDDGIAQTSYTNAGGRCASKVVRDYGSVFSQLPPRTRPGREGILPFGPRGLHLDESPKRILVPGSAGGRVFSFWLRSHGHRGRLLRLNWVVSARLVAIDRRGRERATVASARRALGRVAAGALGRHGLDLRVPQRPGFYRAEVEFERAASGKQLGGFTQYLRVLRPRTAVRLGVLGSRVVEPGGSLVVRVENLGTRQISHGKYVLDRYQDGHWHLDVGETAAYAPSVRRSIDAGRAGECARVLIPAGSESGLYRVRTQVVASGAQGGRLSWVVREFQVGVQIGKSGSISSARGQSRRLELGRFS